ncbi:probable phytanoyl-CoA dioxygenase [Lingula anatina]|uniref:Probable phytanoyl-CoA dioxygenase n=1 Tax=Lingula anatina TaxID=7574 RepID=A0A1S3IAR4_LINAN|nr:probable phytanoyl-CoA dioxygenase [Lingula anatina]|eukprot:XP_013395258.1 probable phytanoyl-CoA dioxygenase [Lingula anatina]
MTLWNHPGDDVAGMVARCEKVVNAMETFLDGEVYHYQTKLIQKEAHTGGSYWFPDMATVFIAIDRADRNNGCLQVLPGSHRLGRIDHVPIGNQTGADLERVKQVSKVLPLTYVELNPGDAAFFHCNLLHTSDQNNSDRRRWALICSYNSARNNPVIAHHHPQYTPLKKVPNKAILECPWMADKSEESKWFYKETDSTPQGLAVKCSWEIAGSANKVQQPMSDAEKRLSVNMTVFASNRHLLILLQQLNPLFSKKLASKMHFEPVN